ncbi:hypothetical protein TNCV_2372051 [Trichonephila clavipes]|nr:hypothetical protein TNCV_2372051 [Trichonephila clavipes]
MTPELESPSPNYHQREDVSALDRFNVHHCPTRRVFSSTGSELVTRQATIRFLYYSATVARDNHGSRIRRSRKRADQVTVEHCLCRDRLGHEGQHAVYRYLVEKGRLQSSEGRAHPPGFRFQKCNNDCYDDQPREQEMFVSCTQWLMILRANRS